MILVSGCFDGLHYGHLQYLRAAREHRNPQEPFVIGLAPDEYIRAAKGRQSQWSTAERGRVLAALDVSYRDAVVIHGPDGAADLIMFMKPRLFIKGSDWKGRIPADVQDACNAVGCRIEFVDSGVRQHTSDAIPA